MTAPRLPARSMGLQLLLVCALALLMSIPSLFVFGILRDRTNRADQVSQELGQLSGGPQTFLGPVLAVELLRHATDAWDVAMLALALPLAWRLGR